MRRGIVETKKCAIYTRVSSVNQAMVQEGSLKNQEEALRRYVEMKDMASSNNWKVINVYSDEGISGKDTKRPMFQQMLEDIKRERINTVICTALSRISRSTRDLLDLVEWFHKHQVDFICLKEQFDTTTPQGKMFLTIMAALNQFEREQTSERTRFNMLARSRRGLWQGGYLLGYDLDKERKGYLIPNKEEVKIVNFIFDTYLQEGSVAVAARKTNERGYRSKGYTTSTKRIIESKPFRYSSALNVLNNQAYIGKKEVNKKNKGKDFCRSMKHRKLVEDEKYTICDAVWPGIVNKEKFDRAQKLLAENYQHKNNGAVATKHQYLFNHGALYCHKCGSPMTGRNGHGCKGRVYYYYYCLNNECREKVSEPELELCLQRLVTDVAKSPYILNKIVNKVNEQLGVQIPELQRERHDLSNELGMLEAKASRIIDEFSGIGKGKEFLEKRLSELDARKKNLGQNIEVLDSEIVRLKDEEVTEGKVKTLLKSFKRIFDTLTKPYQKRKLLEWVLERIKVSEEGIKAGFKAKALRSDIVQMLRSGVVLATSPGSQIRRGGAFCS